MPKLGPELFNYLWAKTQAVKGHIWENNKVHTGQKKPFAPKITASYPFITKRARILWPIHFVGPKPEELDDTADGDNENDKSSHR